MKVDSDALRKYRRDNDLTQAALAGLLAIGGRTFASIEITGIVKKTQDYEKIISLIPEAKVGKVIVKDISAEVFSNSEYATIQVLMVHLAKLEAKIYNEGKIHFSEYLKVLDEDIYAELRVIEALRKKR